MRAEPFIGSEAMASGSLNRYQLRTQYSALLPDVYLKRRMKPSLRQRTTAAWLWSQRRGVVAGLAASAVRGSKWIDDDTPVALIWRNTRPPRGVVTCNDTVLSGEFQMLNGLPITTPARTAFDLGRRGSLSESVARLDALARATGFKVRDVEDVMSSHRRIRGVRQLETALDLVDSGAQSPKETWLRLVLINAGLPKPQTQIPVYYDGAYPFAFLDMGWNDAMVAVEYDGDQHRTDRFQYVKDIRRLDRLRDLGWAVVRVIAEDRPAEIVGRVRRALNARSS